MTTLGGKNGGTPKNDRSHNQRRPISPLPYGQNMTVHGDTNNILGKISRERKEKHGEKREKKNKAQSPRAASVFCGMTT